MGRGEPHTPGPEEGYAGAGEPPVPLSKHATNLKPGTTYKVRVVSYDFEEFIDRHTEPPYAEFTTKGTSTPPSATLDPVTTITSNSAHFSATVDTHAPAGALDAEGKAAYKTEWHFECVPTCPGNQLSGTVQGEEGSKTVSVDAKGLEANIPYQVRLIAKNTAGTGEGAQTFHTPFAKPTVTSLAGGSDGEGGYTLAGLVNPNNSKVTSCEFKWGPNSANYAFSAPCSPTPAGRNEVQEVKIYAETSAGPDAPIFATEGQFKLTFLGQTTNDLPFDATPAEVEAELKALSTIGPNDVSVTAGSVPFQTFRFYVVTFQGLLAETDVTQIQGQQGTVPLSANGGYFGGLISVSTSAQGGNSSPITVEAHLPGLNVGSVYHFRLFATNAAGTESSKEDEEFVATLPEKVSCPNEELRKENNSIGLPECRAYEMVSYPNKEGKGASFGANSGGEAVEYSSAATNIGGSGLGLIKPSQYVATRTAVGWETIPNLNGPTGSLSGAPEYAEPDGFDVIGMVRSADLLSSIWGLRKKDSPTGTYLRRPDGRFELVGLGLPRDTGGSTLGLYASDDLSHLVLASKGGFPTASYGPGVYEFVGTGNDQPRRVDVDNTGAPICDGVSNGNAISRGGRVIVFSTACGSVWAQVDATTSYDISASQCNRTDCNAPAPAKFQGAAKDGSRVYFTTTQQLVNGDTDETNDLYACDIPTTAQAPVGAANPCTSLTEVSGSGSEARVEQFISSNGFDSQSVYVSDDGATAYFAAKASSPTTKTLSAKKP